jgi:hypothetical protein
VIIGDAELTMELVNGERLVHRMEQVRHGNHATLIVGPALLSQRSKADPQLLILLEHTQPSTSTGAHVCRTSAVIFSAGNRSMCLRVATDALSSGPPCGL